MGKLHGDRPPRHIACGLPLYRRDTHGEQALHYGGHDPGVCGYVVDALIAAVMGYPDQGVSLVHKGVELARELDHPPSLAQALWFAAELYQIRREPKKVQDSVSAVCRRSRERDHVARMGARHSGTH